MRLGNGRWENTVFNSRLQPVQIGLGSSATSQNVLKLNFDYGISDNNGNVKSQTITTPTVGTAQGFTATQTYTYDPLNRIHQATEVITGQTANNWQQTFVYDRYGNRTFDEANTTTLQKNCGTAPNKVVCAADVAKVNPSANQNDNKLIGTNYDTAGNTKVDANGQTFIYDAENKQVEVRDAANNIVGQYAYDGDGKRIKKYVPGTGETTVFVYDASNKLVAEYSTIAASQTDAKISYLTNDHLGSPRITTDGNGQVVSRRDFMPFGEEIARANYGSDSVRQKFTGYERDTETDLDYAKARMFGSSVGRFTSPDPLLGSAKRINPQTWNRYIYVGNNPLKYSDPSGLDWGYRKKRNGRLDLCEAPSGDFSKSCKGYTRFSGDSVIDNFTVGGINYGTVILRQSGGWEHAVPVTIEGVGTQWVSQKDISAINDVTGGAFVFNFCKSGLS